MWHEILHFKQAFRQRKFGWSMDCILSSKALRHCGGISSIEKAVAV